MSSNENIKFFMTLELLCRNVKLKVYFDEYLILKILNNSNVENIKRILAELLLNPNYTLKITKYFSKYLLQLLFIAIPLNSTEFKINDYNVHLKYCISLGLLANQHPDANKFILQYFEEYPSPFDKEFFNHGQFVIPRKRQKIDSSNVIISDELIVKCCYNFLKMSADFFRPRWNWSIFVKQYCNNENSIVNWLSLHCIAIITGMNEVQLNTLIYKVHDEEITNDFIIKNLKMNDDKLLKLKINNYIIEEDDEKTKFKKPRLHSNVVDVAGIFLPIYKKNLSITHLVPVKSTHDNLRKVALGIAANRAICLQGPVGSSKTALVEYLAKLTGRKLGESFIKVQLGDQTDSKMLLGTYRCTDIPGEFVWQPGVLTQAVTEGSWLLLEDIDSASMDIATVIMSLLENGYLSVPGFRDTVPITPGFHLFVTQRLIASLSGFHKKHNNVTSLLEKHILQINIEPLTDKELIEITRIKYPNLKTIASKIVDVFMLFSKGHSKDLVNISSSGRLTSTRDLFKWCDRAIVDFDVSSENSALKVLQDAMDIFCCSFPSNEDRLKLAKEICSRLGIVDKKAEYYCNSYKPNLSLSPNKFIVGRTTIQREISNDLLCEKSKFSFTKPSACLLERLIGCVTLKEPVLLVGETGTGKTSSIQYLAQTIGQKLIVINMNQQSDSADLLGGYKPVDMKHVIGPIKVEFEILFRSFFNLEVNKKFLENFSVCFAEGKWSTILSLMKHCRNAAIERLESSTHFTKTQENDYFQKWTDLGIKLNKLSLQLKQDNSLAFAFIKGSLVKAIENGDWVLLDEINLANAETLECLSGLLESSHGSLSLLERGDKNTIKRHKKFTLFACMNPSTDVGKKDLPAGLRNRFTEFFIEELTEKNDLILLVNSYLKNISVPQDKIERIVKFYLNIRKEAVINLSDGLGHKPHYSLRTLCRALTIATKNNCGTVERNLYEAFCLSFLTQLDTKSYKIVEKMIEKTVIQTKDAKSVLKQLIPEPKSDKNNKFVQFEGYWVCQGQLKPDIPKEYVLTESVRRNLKDLARIVAIGKLPVLLQGDTSVGKTSLITYLAKASGNKCVRINNHEHTDLQEYIGSYIADEDGKLMFREGVLVEAMRKGHWIILDELNLAPTDVLEALNRVLDDNRELFIPETQETIKAHTKFMLFATQNPPGAYGGRKILSRAFRNRFVELHFNEIPPKELEIILHERCKIPLSYTKKMIAVMTELQLRRRGSATFAGKQGFITLRNLFRWGERYRLARNIKGLYDWDQHIADEGYLVLAGRVRKVAERNEIAEVLKKHIKRSVITDNLFTLHENTSPVTKDILQKIYAKRYLHKNIVWTFNTRQLAVLIGKALQFSEPVLLVGETGGGKTTICKLIAENDNQKLITVNCHMHTESADFIGSLRPIRERNKENKDKLFEWVDGPLIQAMQSGDVFLADEISLADDSVLERLNSLLEPERSLLLAEKASDLTVQAHPKFHFIGTMNPGGDFGKKELSPALRNRFTEIWCELCSNIEDLIAIIEHNLIFGLSFGKQEDESSGIGRCILDFIEWFKSTEIGKRFTISIRDILTWVNFINKCLSSGNIKVADAYFHGACLTFLDSLGSGITGMESTIAVKKLREEATEFLINQIKINNSPFTLINFENLQVISNSKLFGITPFYIKKRKHKEANDDFNFNAPTVLYNTLRLLRGLQLNKALLLEGSPGVGKTSLVTALAKITNHKLLRINLSDQTDICDLFGADLPVEGGQGGEFAWRDGPFLQALKNGDWIVLDELNLASQSVLEGLNACLDHRGEIFIPELGKTFYVKPGTHLFACQNPLRQGGSRRGLPKSFLNRFTQVYIDSLNENDLDLILRSQFPQISQEIRDNMIEFNEQVVFEIGSHKFGHKGAPWEFNLRDLTRWCQIMLYNYQINPENGLNPCNTMELIYADRMRTEIDKLRIQTIFESVFNKKVSGNRPLPYITPEYVYMGDVKLNRGSLSDCEVNLSVLRQESNCLLLRSQFQVLRSLMYCVNLNWMAILVGSSASGKSSVVRTLSQLTGNELRTLSVNSAMDTTDILGGFEQADYNRHLEEISIKTERILLSILQRSLLEDLDFETFITLLEKWENYRNIQHENKENITMTEETKLFKLKLLKLKKILISLKDESYAASNLNNLNILQNRLEKLEENVQNEGTLNAGGKFEWVDSILIKCLQDGCWLIIENVNLCSPAVLDRLNALLEPNGVLTISERGVDENGELIQIVPHPNFRLFLTMDPKNGEISRAMRNRGVEIYMLNEIESKKSNEFDQRALIEQNGLFFINLQKMLIHAHYFLSEIILGEKPTISHILQASFLISQQLLRGINIYDAFNSSLLDVYIKTRPINEFTINDPVTEVQGFVEIKLENYNNELFCTDNRTLKTMALQENSRLELIKQQNFFLNKNMETVYHHLLSYFVSSKNNVDLRKEYIFYKLIKNEFKNLKDFHLEVHTFFDNDNLVNLDMPLDALWLLETPDKIVNSFQSNQIFIALFFEVLKVIQHKREERKPKKQNTLSVMEYSEAVTQKKLSDVIDNPIILNFYNLLTRFDYYLKDALHNDNFNFNANDTIFACLVLHWRFILQDVGNLVIFDKKLSKTVVNNVVPQIIIRIKWFMKHTLSYFANEDNQYYKPIEEVLNRIKPSMQKNFSNLPKIARQFNKQSNKVLPLISKNQIDDLSFWENIIEESSLIRLNNFDIKTKCFIAITESNFQHDLMAIRKNIRSNISNQKELQKLKDYLRLNIKKDLISSQRIELLIIKDMFATKVLSELQVNIVSEEIDKIVENYATFKKLSIFCPDLMEVLESYIETKSENLFSEFTLLKTTYLNNSISLSPCKLLNLTETEEEEEQKEETVKNLSYHVPLLLYTVSNLCISPSYDLLSSMELGKYNEKTSQMKYLIEFLWQNVSSISSINYLKNDVLYITKSSVKFVKLLEKSLFGYNSKANFDQTVLICQCQINNIFCRNKESENLVKDKNKCNDLLNKLKMEINKINNTKNELYLTFHTAKAFCLLNYLKCLINSQLPVIDPLEKNILKKRFCEEEKTICINLQKAFLYQNNVYSGQDKTLHPFYSILSSKIEENNKKRKELDAFVAVRPKDAAYSALTKEVSHIVNTLLSPELFLNIFDRLKKCVHNLYISLGNENYAPLKAAKSTLQRSVNWLHSHKNCCKKLSKYRTGYPDIVEELLSNLVELSYGVKLLNALMQKLMIRYEYKKTNLNTFVKNIIQFPVLHKTQTSVIHLIRLCIESRDYFLPKATNDKNLRLAKQENLRMLKCAAQELYNLFSINLPTFVDPKNEILILLNDIINLFVSAWNKQEAERQKKLEEEQSLYKIISKCETLTEEEERYKEMKALFPNYHELDFSDFQQQQLTDSKENRTSDIDVIGTITDDDVRFFAEIHSDLIQMFTKSEWLNLTKIHLEPDFVTPLLQRYKLFNFLRDKLIEGLDNNLESNLISSISLLVSLSKHHGEGENLFAKITTSPRKTKEKSYDFYRDSKVDEVKSCFHILEILKKRILELLEEWPNHPTLESILTVVDRIYSFPITSPVSRFLTGLEILLSKCNEWEENAHSGVSLLEYSQNITLQIISWRKLELNGWKDCLNNAFDRVKNSVSKWWSHLYSTINEYIHKKVESFDDVIITFQEFMEKSSLGEFESRLNLLFVFHCYSLHFPPSENKTILVSLLWNLYHYYNQYKINVESKLKNLRNPIEKKLKDFVKIARWNDINYWSLKDTVEKTHKTLHKYIKEFENCLKQPVTDCLVNNFSETNLEQVGIWDRPTRHIPSHYHYNLDVSSYLFGDKYKKQLTESDLIQNTEKYFNKSRNLCKNVISASSYPNLIQNVNSFVTEIIETSNHLRNLDINKELDKKKQKSQAKSILQQKKKALADLFKTLAKCGLSYRTGIIEANLKNRFSELLIKPIDLNASFAQLKNRGACDKQLLNIWDGCETYFLRTISRLTALDASLKQPSKDLGLQNIERCKGFSYHLSLLAQEQKIKLIETTRNFYYLRNFVNQLTDMSENSQIIELETLNSINNLLINIALVMEQYKIILLSFPDRPNFETDLFDIPIINNENLPVFKYTFDENWNKCLSEIQNIISASQKLKFSLEKLENKFPATDVSFTSNDYVFIHDKKFIIEELKNILSKIRIVESLFNNESLSDSFIWLENEIESKLENLENYTMEIEKEVSVESFKSEVSTLVEDVLVIFQNIYKKYQKNDEENTTSNNEEKEKEDNETFNDNHLKGLVIENLFQDISTLEMKNIFNKVKKLTEKIYRVNIENSENFTKLINSCVPFLEQLFLLYEYFITQQVSAYRVTCKLSSVLLKIFIELASKGFCIPEEFSDELNAEGDGMKSGGMGLGDGEGEKDVSDKIESEDQLEDAQPAGQERKDEDKDCTEEEKGIDMNDDFEGKLQDVNKPDNEEKSQSDSDSDAEKQMGETEEDSNRLDQQIWGSDEEEEDNENQDETTEAKQDKEEKGEGGELEDQEMAAKEDGSKADENDKQSNKEKNKKQKDINELDEPEFDEDQVDPYHGNQSPLPEPEPMELSDDLQLDDGEEKEEQTEENPFDIDTMKEQMPPEEEKEEQIDNKESNENEKKSEDNDLSDEDEIPPLQLEAEDELESKDENNDNQETSGMQKNNENEEKSVEEIENENASALDHQQSNETDVQSMEVDNVDAADKVQTNPNETHAQKSDQVTQNDNESKDGVGESQKEKSESGHHGISSKSDSISGKNDEEPKQKQKRPGESDSNRSLGETSEPIKKKLKTIDIADKEDTIDEEMTQEQESDTYQHIKEAKKNDVQMMDAATNEQAEEQKIQTTEDNDEKEGELLDESVIIVSDDDESEPETAKQKSEKTEHKSEKTDKNQKGDIVDEMKDIEVEGEFIETLTVPRGNDTGYHTQYNILSENTVERLNSVQIQDLKNELENQLGTWNEPPPTVEAEQTWEKFSALTSSLARDLSEQLRLVLEPTQASRLRGDFRTGRRINMRKVIPYIASQFRKDKIWLRRTKPSKRDYQIVLAIDDSSSMADNHSKELAFESVALISKALSLLESGQLSVLRFGETTEILHKLTDTFTEKTGVKLLQNFQFQQSKTCVANLVDFVTTMFSNVNTSAPNAKLLIIVSDGRGIFSEGEIIVQQAIRRAKFADIFMVFVIIDNPLNKSSILDIRMPVFKDGKINGIKSYLDSFPFPFYIILRDINSLPTVLSDALRQWFELVTNVDK